MNQERIREGDLVTVPDRPGTLAHLTSQGKVLTIQGDHALVLVTRGKQQARLGFKVSELTLRPVSEGTVTRKRTPGNQGGGNTLLISREA